MVISRGKGGGGHSPQFSVQHELSPHQEVGLEPKPTQSASHLILGSDLNKQVKVKVKSLSPVRLFTTPWTVAHQAPLAMGFSRQEYRSGCHFLLQGIFPMQGWKPGLLQCRQTLYHLSHQGAQRHETFLNVRPLRLICHTEIRRRG